MRLAIIGAGRIGLAINDLLEDDFDIKLCDSRVAAETYGVNLPIIDFIDASDIKMLGSFMDYSDVVISAVNYKFNRAVLFDSEYFHETDKINFKDGYETRRINITYLFGDRHEK